MPPAAPGAPGHDRSWNRTASALGRACARRLELEVALSRRWFRVLQRPHRRGPRKLLRSFWCTRTTGCRPRSGLSSGLARELTARIRTVTKIFCAGHLKTPFRIAVGVRDRRCSWSSRKCDARLARALVKAVSPAVRGRRGAESLDEGEVSPRITHVMTELVGMSSRCTGRAREEASQRRTRPRARCRLRTAPTGGAAGVVLREGLRVDPVVGPTASAASRRARCGRARRGCACRTACRARGRRQATARR